jgi:hypothetical protein
MRPPNDREPVAVVTPAANFSSAFPLPWAFPLPLHFPQHSEEPEPKPDSPGEDINSVIYCLYDFEEVTLPLWSSVSSSLK